MYLTQFKGAENWYEAKCYTRLDSKLIEVLLKYQLNTSKFAIYNKELLAPKKIIWLVFSWNNLLECVVIYMWGVMFVNKLIAKVPS